MPEIPLLRQLPDLLVSDDQPKVAMNPGSTAACDIIINILDRCEIGFGRRRMPLLWTGRLDVATSSGGTTGQPYGVKPAR